MEEDRGAGGMSGASWDAGGLLPSCIGPVEQCNVIAMQVDEDEQLVILTGRDAQRTLSSSFPSLMCGHCHLKSP